MGDVAFLAFAIAVGLSLAKLPGATSVDGWYATASVLVLRQWWNEIAIIRNAPSLSGSMKRAQILWRLLLCLCIVHHFVVEIEFRTASMGESMYHNPGLANVWAVSLFELLLHLVLFIGVTASCQPPHRSRWDFFLPGVVAVWVGLFTLDMTAVVPFIQYTIESLELALPHVHFGPLSQYASDSGTMYAGIEQDIRLRNLAFVSRGFSIRRRSGLLWLPEAGRQTESFPTFEERTPCVGGRGALSFSNLELLRRAAYRLPAYGRSRFGIWKLRLGSRSRDVADWQRLCVPTNPRKVQEHQRQFD